MTKLSDKLAQRSEKEIQEEYQAVLPELGKSFYRAFVPWLETINISLKLLALNYEQAALQQAKAKEEAK